MISWIKSKLKVIMCWKECSYWRHRLVICECNWIGIYESKATALTHSNLKKKYLHYYTGIENLFKKAFDLLKASLLLRYWSCVLNTRIFISYQNILYLRTVVTFFHHFHYMRTSFRGIALCQNFVHVFGCLLHGDFIVFNLLLFIAL